jgi:hypothetical protein
MALELGELLSNQDAKGAYGKAQGWYRSTCRHLPTPLQQDEEETRTEYEYLFQP